MNLLDGVGLSYPDVVIKDKIVGGETSKTAGLRANPDIDYEQEFAKLTALCGMLPRSAVTAGRYTLSTMARWRLILLLWS